MILSQTDYLKTLALARLGVLPFFILACWLLWRWSGELFGDVAAMAAVGVFTNVPSVLAHAGLATTDFCLTATFLLALYGFASWLKQSSLRSGILQGIGLGLAVLSKFSVFVFFPVAAISILLVRWVIQDRCCFAALLPSRQRLWTLAVSLVVCSVTIWAGYRFSIASISNVKDRPHQNITRLLGRSPLATTAANFAVETPIPNPELYRGLIWLSAHAREGHLAFLLGNVRNNGFWYFFPVVILVKTPIAALLLAGIGAWSLMVRARPSAKDWSGLIPIAVTVPILLVCMASSINLGVRHILPIYPFLSMLAGVGLATLIGLRKKSNYFLAGAVILAIWLVSSSVYCHPDYISYFNEFGGVHPEKILVESDLDWGQDVPRLREELRRRNIQRFSIAYFGSADLSQQNLPPFEELKPYEPRDGWVAISLTTLQVGGRPNTRLNAGLAYDWLQAYKPAARIGRSMRLYYVPTH
jgi:4-amino-4-deoxy-L-arabinose transferase-like glycosyltransferase